MGLPGWLGGKEFMCNAGDMIQSLGREDPLEKEMAAHQYSCLENPMDGGDGWATVLRVTKSRT